MGNIQEYIEENKGGFYKELKELVKIKSISTQPEYQEEIEKAQQQIQELLEDIGAKIQVLTTEGNDAVYGEIYGDKNAKTVLVYGHYDVQPVKEDEWSHNPFRIEEKEGAWYGRGVADDKGPLLAIIKAIETLQQTEDINLNIKFLLEGEEEIGSKHLHPCIKENKNLLESDLVLISDTSWVENTTPTLIYGLRGMMYAYITVDGPRQELHSGSRGGVVRNPHIEIARILTNLKDEDGNALLPGFYQNIRQPTEEEIKRVEEVPLDVEKLKEEVGEDLITENKKELLIRKGHKPTLEVHGITGGYTGPGSKTIIPAYAEAKVSTRLVPDQTPDQAFKSLKKKVKELNPNAELTLGPTAHPYHVSTENEYLQKAAETMQEVYDEKPVFAKEGGSIPAVATLNRTIQTPVILFGINNADCQVHSPKENLRKEHFYKGIQAISKYLKNI